VARRLFVVYGLLCAIFSPNSLPAAQFMIDPARSELVVQLFKTGVGAPFAHDHIVRATRYSGQIRLDPSAPTAAEIVVEVDATALIADEPETRQKYKLPLGLSEENRREIQQALESESQLHVRRYPKIRFRSTRILVDKEGRYTVSGNLELRGATKSVALVAQAELKDGVLHAMGSARFLQSSFGYQPYSAFLGAVKNRDEVVLRFDIVAIRQLNRELKNGD
jgi:polyisoprenoid-binding protein YceI